MTGVHLAVQCALLHDVIEDTEVTYQHVVDTFGSAVADGVLALSKDKNLEKMAQMEDSLRRIRQQPLEVWMVKLADRITNLQLPFPSYWDKEKIATYRREAITIHKALKDASPYLAHRLQMMISQCSLPPNGAR
jgi:(p)ppGpp synthase/HD superfamily hydrolase